jgi:Skp family chaperone for outer membrane proteins
MLPRDIKKAEKQMFDWNAYEQEQGYERERREREELKQQMLKLSDVLGERQGSSTCIKCGKYH